VKVSIILSIVFGVILISLVLLDAFETVVFPRRVTRRLRLTRAFYRYTWLLWSSVIESAFSGRRRENLLSVYGPMSLPTLVGFWALMLISGFALLYWAFGPLARGAGMSPGFLSALYFSATTFFTLGLGDTIPTTPPARLLTGMEAGVGFVFLAMIIGYLPALNQSFSRREVSISLLDARAGSPPSAAEILRRNCSERGTGPLEQLLHDWEYWAAELLESHLSYPVLAYFRSQHENQSWLTSLTALLDTTTLVMIFVEGDCERQAQRTFAMARHAVVDLALIFETPPEFQKSDRLPPATLGRLLTDISAHGMIFQKKKDADSRLAEMRQMYEPYVIALSRYFHLTLPAWISEKKTPDNWQQSAWSPRKRSRRQSPGGGIGEGHF
jgi:hypothetical protein